VWGVCECIEIALINLLTICVEHSYLDISCSCGSNKVRILHTSNHDTQSLSLI
jgi:hypothetical protein